MKPTSVACLGLCVALGACGSLNENVAVEPTLESSRDALQTSGNPFAGAKMYVNPDYTRSAEASRQALGAHTTNGERAHIVGRLPTGVWLDRVAAIRGGASNAGRLGLTGHLDAALAQGDAARKPAVAAFVVYDLPNRDCAAAASNGEFTGSDALPAYKSRYIDAIYSALTAKAEYRKVRVVLIIEPDSLPNLITNMSQPACAAAAADYEAGVRYALDKLGSVANVWMYLDIAHSGWLGWPDNLERAVALYANIVKSSKHRDAIRGVATDISNYTPVVEPYLDANDPTVIGSPFYEHNPVIDERAFVTALSAKFTAAGWPQARFVVDTSRSGWSLRRDGRPIDRRKARGNWCNVTGAGVGARPQAAPKSVSDKIDAFIWVKPPGESDGTSLASTSPDTEGKRFDPNCDPANPRLDAMPNAPAAGHWFHQQFKALLQNATPPLTVSSPSPPRPTPPSGPSPRPTQACSVQVRASAPWRHAVGWASTVEVEVKNGGTAAVPVPWDITISHTNYAALDQAWNFKASLSRPGVVAGKASDAWQVLQPNGATSATLGLVVAGPREEFTAPEVAINGVVCKLTP